MSKTDAHEAHYRRMSEAPVSGLVTRMAIPSIITMVISSIYNMADTFFVSRLNISASGAVGIVFSIMAIIQAVGFSLGMGSGSLVSRHLGAKEKEQADTVASAGFFSALAAGAAIATALSQCVSFGRSWLWAFPRFAGRDLPVWPPWPQAGRSALTETRPSPP